MNQPSHPNAADGSSLPPLTDDEKHDAFEWLREFALSTQPGARKAYIALREWSDLKSARSESVHTVSGECYEEALRACIGSILSEYSANLIVKRAKEISDARR